MPGIRRRQARQVALLFALLSCAAPVAAHDPGLSSVVVRIGQDTIEAAIRVSEVDFRGPLGSSALRLRARGRDLVPERFRALAGEQGVYLRYRTQRPSDLTVTSELLAQLPLGHRQYARIEVDSGALIADRMLTRAHPSLEVALTAENAGLRSHTAAEFVRLGIEHILEGYDHLLFLFVLLVGCSGWRPVLAVITAFTAAHSFSLAAATLGWIELSPVIVEPAIAASIIYVALSNLMRSGQRGERLAVTFALGLIHGLGFAGVLADLGVASDGSHVVVPLLAFNAGVELGQLAVTAIALPALLALRRHPLLGRSALPAGTAFAAALGFLWLIERTLLA